MVLWKTNNIKTKIFFNFGPIIDEFLKGHFLETLYNPYLYPSLLFIVAIIFVPSNFEYFPDWKAIHDVKNSGVANRSKDKGFFANDAD